MARSVLVVDDDPTFRGLAQRMLTAHGLAVIGEADTVEAARDAATKLRPDAALVDVRLPDGDGITLARELTGLPWRPSVVLTSSDGESVSADDVQDSGANAFFSKQDLPNAPLGRLMGGS
jgi:DNA-binding NarL/FixJ family response regulator